MTPRIVAGEPTDVLVAAFRQLEYRRTRAGTVRISGTLNRELGDPLRRALTTIERELLAQDKAAGGRTHARTPQQRRADALVLLVTRLADTLKGASRQQKDTRGLRPLSRDRTYGPAALDESGRGE